jgi:methionyl aminopeptidase
MIRYKNEKEISILRAAGKHLALVLNLLKEKAVAGISTKELDDIAREEILAMGDIPVLLNYKPEGATRPFPATVCISMNDEIVHGIPNENSRILKNGDIITFDLCLTHAGMTVDSAITVPVGKISQDAKLLLKATREGLEAGIKAIKIGGHIGDISNAIEKIANRYGMGIADGLSGHGVGFGVHEDPFVPNWGEKGDGPELKKGLVIAIEPMFTLGTDKIKLAKDKWTYKTADGSLSAHFEHTVVVTEKGAEVLTKL